MTDTQLQRYHVPTTTRVLGNGLRVVAHHDSTSPIVAVHLMYHVGSRDEPAGCTGVAHLLEHLLFEGTLNCPKGEFDTLLEEVGGTNNGSTWLDRTNYYETVPTHAAELALWLERERLTGFLPVFDDAMLELQRGVVINERLQTTENRPYGMAEETLYRLLFPAEHPYSWPVIGSMEDLHRMTRDDVGGFFASHYTPANATLVLAGDVEPERAFDLAERFFGDLPTPEAPRRATAPDTPAPTGMAHDTLLDRVSFPRLFRAHRTAPYGSPEWNAMDVLAYVLGDGESSRLQRALVRDRQLAQDVDTYLLPTQLEGVFGVVATARTGVTAEALDAAIAEQVASVAAGGIADDELAGAIRRIRRDQMSALGNVEDRAEALAYADTVLGDAEALNRVMDAYLEVGREEVIRAAEQLMGAGGATLSVLPNGEATDDEG